MFIKIVNKFIQISYYILFVILFFFVFVSVFSYLNVYVRYGEVPSSNDYVDEFINSGKHFNIFPEKYGIYVIISYLYGVLYSAIFAPLVLIMKQINRKIEIKKTQLILLIILQVLVFIQISHFKYIGWYFGYVLD